MDREVILIGGFSSEDTCRGAFHNKSSPSKRVRTFEILCPFFNICPNVLVFIFFFQMKLSGKIGWVSLNNMSKKLFEFDLNIFHPFKDPFFKVLVTDVVADGMPLMLNGDREPHFMFY